MRGKQMSRGKILGDGQYKVGERLGDGAFSRVYRCVDLVRGIECAVKVVNMAFLRRNAELEDALCREINSMELVSSLNCPYTMNLIDKLQSTRNYYIVMDLADGGTLCDIITRSIGGLSQHRASVYFTQMLLGLHAIHSSNVVHRDIKP